MTTLLLVGLLAAVVYIAIAMQGLYTALRLISQRLELMDSALYWMADAANPRYGECQRKGCEYRGLLVWAENRNPQLALPIRARLCESCLEKWWKQDNHWKGTATPPPSPAP